MKLWLNIYQYFPNLLFLIFVLMANSCPYQSMAKIDSQLFSTKNQIDTNTFKKISTLRSQGELALQNGDIEKSEKILNEALALFK